MLVDLSQYNHMSLHQEWYPDAMKTNSIPTRQEIDSFLNGLDVVFLCETPLNYYLFDRARELGIKTVLQYNFEFLDYMRFPAFPRPTVLAAPTQWHLKDAQEVAGVDVINLPVPIDLAELPQRTITEARKFFHIAGRVAVHDRNGTLDFIQAARLAAPRIPDAEFIVYIQQPTPEIKQALQSAPVRVVWNVPQPADMYKEGDVLVLPRRYGGLCLPAQEAVGCGIPVLMPDISPNNSWLPQSWLIPATRRGSFMARCQIDVYSINVQALANRMIALATNDQSVIHRHEEAKQLARSMSWDALLPMYQEVLGL
jgi:glycosyltransferase involved in cell wall biosynthesis